MNSLHAKMKGEEKGTSKSTISEANADVGKVARAFDSSHDYTCFFGIYTGYIGCLYSRSSLVLRHRPYPPPTPAPEKRVTRVNLLSLRRTKIQPEHFLEKVHRNFLTGSIVLEGVDPRSDFSFVDLQNRETLEGTPEQLAEDETLLLPIPLVWRTWLFHCTFEYENSVDSLVKVWNAGQKSIRSLDEIRISCIESSISDLPPRYLGKYSPSVAALLSFLISSFTLDKAVFAVNALLVILTVRIAVTTNQPNRFRFQRVLTLLFRLGLVVWVASLGVTAPLESGLALTSSHLPGYIRMLSAVILILDIIFGDMIEPIMSKFRDRSFRVVESLPNRVFICEMHGMGRANVYSETILGLERYRQQSESTKFAVIADIQGLLFELRPTTIRDFPEPVRTTGYVPMYSIDCFTKHVN